MFGATRRRSETPVLRFLITVTGGTEWGFIKRTEMLDEVRMLYFSLPQIVNYSAPPNLRKPLYAAFFQSYKLLLYFILPYSWVYILEVQYEIRCSNSKFSLYRFKYYVFLNARSPNICQSVCPSAWNNLHLTSGFSRNYYLSIFENHSRKFKCN